jgi:hypothetical protein
MVLTRDQILGADDLKKEEVQCPDWNGSVFVRTLTGLERDRFEQSYDVKNPNGVRAQIASATVCDEAGNLLFTPADIALLAAKSCRPLDRIFDVATRLNKWTKADIDELEKNSSASPYTASPIS